jgi:hypothetical protein
MNKILRYALLHWVSVFIGGIIGGCGGFLYWTGSFRKLVSGEVDPFPLTLFVIFLSASLVLLCLLLDALDALLRWLLHSYCFRSPELESHIEAVETVEGVDVSIEV